jgi:hypothetical protein
MRGDKDMAVDVELARARLRAAAERVPPACGICAHPLASVVGALAAGFIVGASPKLTESVAEIVLRIARSGQLTGRDFTAETRRRGEEVKSDES